MLAAIAFCETLSQYPRSAFQGLCGRQSKSQVGMNGDTSSIKAPKECSEKFVAILKGKSLARGNVLRRFFLF